MNTKNLSEYNAKDLYNIFGTLYEEKHRRKYEGAGFIGNELHLLKVALEDYTPSHIACAMLNCFKSSDKTVNVPYFISGLKYYLTSHNPDIYWAVQRYGDENIKKLWKQFLFLDSVWLPSSSNRIKYKEIYKKLKEWTNEKTGKKKRKTTSK